MRLHRFSQNCIFKVGRHDFSKTDAPSLLKFCTCLLNMIDSYFIDLFYRPLHGLISIENRTVLHTTLPKNHFFFLLNPSFNQELYSPTNRKYFIFWFRIKLSRVILVIARILCSKGSLKISSQRLNFHYSLMRI